MGMAAHATAAPNDTRGERVAEPTSEAIDARATRGEGAQW